MPMYMQGTWWQLAGTLYTGLRILTISHHSFRSWLGIQWQQSIISVIGPSLQHETYIRFSFVLTAFSFCNGLMWSWKTYKNTWSILWHKGRSSQMVFIISERPCSICTNRIYFLSRTKPVVWCSSRPSPGVSTQPLLVKLSRGMG